MKMQSVRMVFDDVMFGIDVRDARRDAELTQDQLAALVGYKDGASVSTLECATHADTMTIRRYMTLCNVLNLNPMHYWDFDPEINYADVREGGGGEA